MWWDILPSVGGALCTLGEVGKKRRIRVLFELSEVRPLSHAEFHYSLIHSDGGYQGGEVNENECGYLELAVMIVTTMETDNTYQSWRDARLVLMFA